MVICIVALAVFSILGIGSMKYRRLAKEAFDCVFRTITFRPCVTKLDERIKTKLTSKLMERLPMLARFVYRKFKFISWIFTITFFASSFYSAYGIYNLVVYGTCDPSSPSTCAVNNLAYVLSCYEAQVVYAIIAVSIVLYVLYLKRRLPSFKNVEMKQSINLFIVGAYD